LVLARPALKPRFKSLQGLAVANFAFDPTLLPSEGLNILVEHLDSAPHGVPVHDLLKRASLSPAATVRALMWLWKFDLVEVGQAPS
jgi:hypothetical protein